MESDGVYSKKGRVKLRLICSDADREWYLKHLIKIIPIKLTEQERKEKRKRIIEALLRND